MFVHATPGILLFDKFSGLISHNDTIGAMKKSEKPSQGGKLSKADYEKLAHFRYQLRRFLRFSEEVSHQKGITSLQYLMLLQIKGFPGREWATVGELAERLQSKHHGVVSLISRCEEAGMVERRISDEDKRRVEVTLTRTGEKCLDELAQLHRAEHLSFQDTFLVADRNSSGIDRRTARIGKAG